MEMGGGRRVGGWVGGSVGEGRRDAVRERRMLQRGGRREEGGERESRRHSPAPADTSDTLWILDM